jgi:hypothetical protein
MTNLAIPGSRPAHSASAIGSIEGVGTTKPGHLRKGKGPGRLRSAQGPSREACVDPGPASTPNRDQNPSLYSIRKGKVHSR